MFAACQHHPPDDLIPFVPPGPDPADTAKGPYCDPDTIYFRQQILPIFQTNCAKAGCHDAITRQEDLVLDSYEGIMEEIEPYDLDESKIFKVISGADPDKTMPPYPNLPLSEEQIGLIAGWINQGARDNACEAAVCDTSNVTYSSSVKPILDLRCMGCHSGGAPQADILLTGYDETAFVAADGKLLAVITHQAGVTPMPYNLPPLPDCEISKIRTWVREGYQNN